MLCPRVVRRCGGVLRVGWRPVRSRPLSRYIVTEPPDVTPAGRFQIRRTTSEVARPTFDHLRGSTMKRVLVRGWPYPVELPPEQGHEPHDIIRRDSAFNTDGVDGIAHPPRTVAHALGNLNVATAVLLIMAPLRQCGFPPTYESLAATRQ